jgi:hypothetical protein
MKLCEGETACEHRKIVIYDEDDHPLYDCTLRIEELKEKCPRMSQNKPVMMI